MGRGYSRSRSLSGRLPNKLKRGIRSLSTPAGVAAAAASTATATGKRSRSDVARTEKENVSTTSAAAPRSALASADPAKRNKHTGGVLLDAGDVQRHQRGRHGASAAANGALGGDNVEDGGVAAHKNIVAQVRARSAMLRQRVLASSTAPSKRGRQWAPSTAGQRQDDENYDDEPSDVESEPPEERVLRPEVLVKYKTCGRITDEVVSRLVAEAKPGASVFALCNLGDSLVMDITANTFTKARDAETGERLKRGVSFPTNVSVNNVLAHQRPYSETDASNCILRVGDVVKIHVGAHIDGFSTQAARTIVVVDNATGANSSSSGSSGQQQADGAAASAAADDATAVNTLEKTMDEHAANAIAAAYYALTALIRAMRPGALGSELTDLIRSFASGFGVEGCEGVLSNRTKRWINDGSQAIINRRVVRQEPQQDVGEVEIEPFQVWTLDVAFTSGESFKLNTDEPTIFRRTELPTPNEMRVRAAESLLHEVRSTFLCFPFCATQSDLGTTTARLGISHLSRMGVLDPVPPVRGKHGVVTARATCTIAVTDKRIHILSGGPVLDATAGRSCMELPPQLVDPVKNVELRFGKSGSGVTKNEDGDEDVDAAPTDGDAGASASSSSAAARAKNKQYVEAAMARVPMGGHTAQQLAALMPPSRKKASGGDAGKKDSETGRRNMKQARVEDD